MPRLSVSVSTICPMASRWSACGDRVEEAFRQLDLRDAGAVVVTRDPSTSSGGTALRSATAELALRRPACKLRR